MAGRLQGLNSAALPPLSPRTQAPWPQFAASKISSHLTGVPATKTPNEPHVKRARISSLHASSPGAGRKPTHRLRLNVQAPTKTDESTAITNITTTVALVNPTRHTSRARIF